MASEDRPSMASEEHVEDAQQLAAETKATAENLATKQQREAKVLESEAALVVDRLRAVEQALRSRTRIIIVVGALIALVGFYMVTLQAQGNTQRELIYDAVQEIKDCTTPDKPDTACQRRLAVTARIRSEDNLRASIAVGSCLREQAPDVEACALTRFREAAERAAAARGVIR